MNQEQFDKSIKQKLDELNFETNDMHWAKLQQALDAQRNEPTNTQPISWWASIGSMYKLAAVFLPLLILSASYLYFTKNSNSNIIVNNKTALPQQSALEPSINTAINPSINKNTIEEIATNTVVAGTGTKKTNNTNSKAINLYTRLNNAANNLIVNNTPTVNPVEAIKKAIQQDLIKELVAEKNVEEKQVVVNEVKKVDALHDKAVADNNTALLPKTNKLIPMQSKAMAKPMHVSIVSNAGLGNNNKGSYNLGISTEKNINKKLFFETVISFANNNLQASTNNTDVTSAAILDNTNNSLVGTTNLNARVSNYKSDAEVVEAIANTTPRYHIEFAPSLGYKITNRIKLSAGVDAAKAVYSNASANDLDYLKSKSSTDVEVRNWDAGANARIELQLTNRITLGYRRRNGLTDITPNQTINSKRNYNNIVLKVMLK